MRNTKMQEAKLSTLVIMNKFSLELDSFIFREVDEI